MKVSIITVCFNSAHTISKTLGSVLEQTYPDIEHIIVDGASTDNTLQIISNTPNRVTHLLSEPDSGIYDAMNKGIARANGGLLCFLNADDIYSNALVIESVVRRIKDDNLDALFGDIAFFHAEQPQKIVRRYRSNMFTPARIPYGWMPAHPALFMRRNIYQNLGGFKTHYRIAGDFEFVARAFYSGSLQYQHLPEILVLMQSGGISTAGLRSTLLLNSEILQACRENGISTNILKILSKYPLKLIELFQR